MNTGTIQVLTSAGYLVNINWDGTISREVFYFQNAGCTGARLLFSNWQQGSLPLYGKTLVYAGASGFMKPETVDGGTEVLSLMTYNSVDDGTASCRDETGTYYGWYVISTTPAAVGLPGLPPYATPLTMQ